MDLKKELNPSQYKAVTGKKGPLLILAGAGSGKTRALTCRIAYFLKEKNENPSNFLAVTFTNKAAEEMRARLIKLVGKKASSLWIATFHSTCARILRSDISKLGYKNNFTIYDQDDSRKLIKNCIKELGYDVKKFSPAMVSEVISRAKNELIGPEEFGKLIENYKDEVIADVFYAYRDRLLENNAVDFDDLLNLAVNLFELFPDILSRYQDKFRFIMIDEYQDTNKAQYVLVNLLAEKYRNITVVGDEDQSIYGWRGADIRNILNFEKDYPEAKIIKLEQNYRSSQFILDSANSLIINNIERKPKELWTENKKGEPVNIYQASNDIDEAEFVIGKIKDSKTNLRNIAVFYRVNAQSRVIEEACMRYKIPYQIIGGVKFYEREEVKDILAYLKVINNKSDSVGLERIINRPNRGIGKASLELLKKESRKSKKPLFEVIEGLKKDKVSPKVSQELDKFLKLLDEASAKKAINESADYIIKKTQYKDYLKRKHPVDYEDRMANVEELLVSAKEFQKANPDKKLNDFLEDVSLVSDIDKADFSSNYLSLMTMHNAKGLEFPLVFITGMEEGLIPHARSMSDNHEIEEERRLCYVAITRAMKELYLSYCLNRHRYGFSSLSIRSRFLKEIPSDFTKHYEPSKPKKEENIYNKGDFVFHQKFGKGKVVSLEDDKISIEFMTGIKQFLTDYAPLEKVN